MVTAACQGTLNLLQSSSYLEGSALSRRFQKGQAQITAVGCLREGERKKVGLERQCKIEALSWHEGNPSS